MEKYHILIPFWGTDISEDFSFRYELCDYIESMEGLVYEEGTGDDGMHLFFETSIPAEEIKEKIEMWKNTNSKYNVDFSLESAQS
ncbi:hypothetical protein [Chryseobacterium takakiae]|uniref:Uncharacterized protein n=1 Tax=Chryseobacterium takakiae TaxID=1302685 RepID=A0A1M5BPH3_9FLAO|nr:hypothetical protein [Chryseobacterium takakiae]SHF44341.1 hypothetical protein SAMN05444408_12122 [Chryseobacterium takakiae]